jgi:hypothetical protein
MPGMLEDAEGAVRRIARAGERAPPSARTTAIVGKAEGGAQQALANTWAYSRVVIACVTACLPTTSLTRTVVFW